MDLLLQLFAFSLITGTFYAVTAIGMHACSVYGRFFNMAVGPLCMTGAYTAFALSEWWEAPLIVNFILFIAIATLTGLILDGGFAAPFRGARVMASFVATLAFGIILEALVSLIFGVSVRSYRHVQGGESIMLGGVYLTTLQIGIVVVGVCITIGCLLVLQFTRVGRMLRALGGNTAAFSALGYNERIVNKAVAVGATILFFGCGVALAAESNLAPTMGAFLTIKAFAAVIFGGQFGLLGVVLAAYGLGIVENFAVGLSWGEYSIPSGYKDAVAYFCILGAMLILHRRTIVRSV